MNFVLVASLLSLVFGISVEIRKGRCGDTPYDICSANGKVGVVTTPQNIRFLMEMLKNNCVPNAYVFGWNDHVYPMVLYPSGALAPYDKFTNTSEYAFCMADCPCPRENIVCVSSSSVSDWCKEGNYNHCPPRHEPHHLPYHPPCPEPCPPYCPPCPNPCPPYCPPCPNPCPPYCPPCPKPFPPCPVDRCPMTCEGSSSSSSSSSCEATTCPIFVKRYKKCFKENKKCHNGKPFLSKEVVSNLKTYTFRQAGRRTYILRAQEETNAVREEKYVVSERNQDCSRYNIPKVLCCPSKLKQVKKYLECKYKSPVCLYVNDCNEIFAIICDVFYRVCVTKRRCEEKITLKKLNKHKVRVVVRKGLFGVAFAGEN